MGIHDRDYYRGGTEYGDHGSWGLGGGMAPVCKRLIAANIVVFLLQILLVQQPQPEDARARPDRPGIPVAEGENGLPNSLAPPPRSLLEQWLRLETAKVVRQLQVWRLLTYAFCHDRYGVWHILFNMLFLYWFGRPLEGMYGSREFLLFYLTAAVLAGLAHVGLDLVIHATAAAIGASGAVMAVTMLYAWHFPRERILVFFISIEVRWLVLLYVIFDLHPVLLALAGDRQFTGVAHAAHLGGLAFGFLYGKYGLRLDGVTSRIRPPRWPRAWGPRRHLRVFQPAQDPEGQVDEILRKIHDRGEASLTERERGVLRAASERYRARNRGQPEP